MGKRLIIPGADFSKNGIEEEKMLVFVSNDGTPIKLLVDSDVLQGHMDSGRNESQGKIVTLNASRDKAIGYNPTINAKGLYQLNGGIAFQKNVSSVSICNFTDTPMSIQGFCMHSSVKSAKIVGKMATLDRAFYETGQCCVDMSGFDYDINTPFSFYGAFNTSAIEIIGLENIKKGMNVVNSSYAFTNIITPQLNLSFIESLEDVNSLVQAPLVQEIDLSNLKVYTSKNLTTFNGCNALKKVKVTNCPPSVKTELIKALQVSGFTFRDTSDGYLTK